MSKTLYLLRHAKADNKVDYHDDHEKPLAKRGVKDCVGIAQHLEQSACGLPQLMLVSDALRTMQTAQHVLEVLPKEQNIQLEQRPDLYLSTPGEMLKALATVPADVDSVMLVAHNPGTHQLAVFLAGQPTPVSQELFMRFPTGSLITFTVDADNWKTLDSSVCTCKAVYFP